MKRHLKKIGKIAGIVCLVLLAVFLVLFTISQLYEIPDQPSKTVNTTGLVQAQGRSLYDADGRELRLEGINAGQLLLQEGWMSPFALEPLYNEDGSYVTDDDGNLQYPEFTEEEFRNALATNSNLAGYDLDSLLAIYRDHAFTESDFAIIREVGFNTIRLPFYYRDLLQDDLSRKTESEAFAYLDWFISQAAQQGLYVVLDLHGAPGSQNGYEHSGTPLREANLWDSGENVRATVDLWQFVATHYTDTAPELGKHIATYDILNEPTYEYAGPTTEECWSVFDQIYRAIRSVGDAHVITMEGCWDFSALPDPAEYGWENIQYSYHWYNWWSDTVPYDVYIAYHDTTNLGRDYDVPVLIGEFTAFEDPEGWQALLDLFRERNYSWTVWNYKTTVTGSWTSSWGLYTCQLNLDTQTQQTKCNVQTCTLEEYIAACTAFRTDNCVTDTLYDVMQNYFG